MTGFEIVGGDDLIFDDKGGGIPMTERQKRFADEYLIDCNASRAYKAA